MLKLVVCESLDDKYIFHEYRGDADGICVYQLDKMLKVVKKDFTDKKIIFIMVSLVGTPFHSINIIGEDHGKAH